MRVKKLVGSGLDRIAPVLSAIWKLLFSAIFDPAPKPKFEKVMEGWAVIQELTAQRMSMVTSMGCRHPVDVRESESHAPRRLSRIPVSYASRKCRVRGIVRPKHVGRTNV
jgi:hypothetical protein